MDLKELKKLADALDDGGNTFYNLERKAWRLQIVRLDEIQEQKHKDV